MATKKKVKRRWRGKNYKAPKKKYRIAKGKAKTGQRYIYRSGGGKGVLAAWKSLGQQRRQKLKKAARTNPNNLGLTQLVRKRVIAPRKKAGKNPQTGAPKTPAKAWGSPTFTTPQERKIPSRMRGWKV